jgi:hypothetical protein
VVAVRVVGHGRRVASDPAYVLDQDGDRECGSRALRPELGWERQRSFLGGLSGPGYVCFPRRFHNLQSSFVDCRVGGTVRPLE